MAAIFILFLYYQNQFLTLIIVVFRFSYLQSQRAQTSCSLPSSLSKGIFPSVVSFGITTFSQLLKKFENYVAYESSMWNVVNS